MPDQPVPARDRSWFRTMTARHPEEEHRSATPLELFFDLCFVVAVGLAAGGLHHAVADGHAGDGVRGYVLVFFAIWWAWMNFTWFASAYDTDDAVYRLTTLVQIAGALMLAAGVPEALAHADFEAATYGYVVMRLAMVFQWLRAAHANPDARRRPLGYAIGIVAVQAAWLGRLALPDTTTWLVGSFVVLGIAELAVPVLAERGGRTAWHPHHVTERYGLFTVLVLGESIFAATTAIQTALESGGGDAALYRVAAAGLVTVFGMWWVYFDRPMHHLLGELRTAITWGYSHLLVFASAAAAGAGLEVAIGRVTAGHAEQAAEADAHGVEPSVVSAATEGWAVAIPVAVFVLSVWLLQTRTDRPRTLTVAMPLVALAMLAAPATPQPIFVVAGLVALLVAVYICTGHVETDNPVDAAR